MTVGHGWRMSVAALALVFGLAACQPAQDAASDAPALPTGYAFVHEVTDLPADPDIIYGRLDNGLRYAVRANQTPPNVASVRMVFNMGSLGEADDQRGLAHFIEHMAFNGSTEVPEGEMVPLLERYGLQFGPDTNAFTGYETVGYQLDLPDAGDEAVETALFLMRQTASELLMDPEAIDRERGVVLSEERVRNTPIRRWNNALWRFRLPDTLIPDRDAIGTTEVLETAQRDRFVDYYENYYTPERGMVVVVGDIDPAAAIAQIEASFADWTGIDNPRPDPEIGTVADDRPISAGYFFDAELYTIFTVDAVRPHQTVLDSAAARFDNNLANIGDAILGRRFATLTSAGNSPLIQAAANHGTDFGVADRASVLTIARPDRWEEAVASVEQELRRAIEHGFTQAELDEQIANLHTALRDGAEQAGTRQTANLSDQIWSNWRSDQVLTTPQSMLERFEETLPQVTPEAVSQAFRAQWADVEPLLFLATSVEMDDAQTRLVDAWQTSASQPVEAPEDHGDLSFAYTDFGTAGTIVSREEIADLGLVRLQFENGVAVTFKPTGFEDRTVRVRLDFGRGELEPRAMPAVDIIAGSVFTAAGLGEHSSDDLGRVLAGRNIGYSFSVGDDSFSFNTATTPGDLRVQMDLLTAFLTDPGWRQEGLDQFQALIPEIRRNSYSTPGGVMSAEVSRLIRSGDERYGLPDPEQVAGVDMAAIEAFLAPALERAPIEVTIVGDVSEADLIGALAPTLGALPARADSWPDYDEARTIVFPDAVADPVVLRHNGPANQARANVYWPTFDDSDPARTRAMALLNAVFDLKLTERLREREGLTYSASNAASESDVYPDYGYLYVGADVRIETVDQTYAAINELAADLASGAISEDEVLRARRPMLEQIENAMENNGAWMSWLAQSWAHPERLDRIRTIRSDYEAVTREDLVGLAATYLSPERTWRVTILPRDAE
ncbi:M16 family metallopeptidase [Maricaulis sp.]|uniref:M16 family metallopeptidase n=1 Tax=Maricaulis sp. TaxID=1486257 RepID=UPI0025C42390|nr:M16 family metallopeptidase [Maricaulis sp.]